MRSTIFEAFYVIGPELARSAPGAQIFPIYDSKDICLASKVGLTAGYGTSVTSFASPRQTLKLVFHRRAYVVLAAASAAILWAIFNILDGLLLLSPLLTFYYPIPEDALPGFFLSIVTAGLSGVVISMNMFLFKSGRKVGKATLMSGSTLGSISSICAGCSSVGFYAASTFGVAGVAASSLLANYQLPLRIVAIAILVLAFVGAHRKISASCKVAS